MFFVSPAGLLADVLRGTSRSPTPTATQAAMRRSPVSDAGVQVSPPGNQRDAGDRRRGPGQGRGGQNDNRSEVIV